MGISKNLVAASILACTVLGGASAQAQVVTKTYDITFDTLIDPFDNQTPPIQPVTASFTLTFDPTVNYNDETSGITVNELNVPVDSTIGFSTGTDASGNLFVSIGGVYDGAGDVIFGTNDFVLQLRFDGGDLDTPSLPLCSDPGFSCGGLPTTYASGYTSSAYPDSLFLGLVATVSPAPEPATWAMMLTGFTGLGGALRLRRKLAAVAA
jgi:hypothetical protein